VVADLLGSVLACLQGGCGGEVAVEVKLATNQLTLFFGSFQFLACWLAGCSGKQVSRDQES
jgi:hypothetical protein